MFTVLSQTLFCLPMLLAKCFIMYLSNFFLMFTALSQTLFCLPMLLAKCFIMYV